MAASPFQKPGRRHNRLRVEQCVEEPPPIRVFFSVFSAGDAAGPFEGFTDEDVAKVESTLSRFPDISQVKISSPVVQPKKKVGTSTDKTPNPLFVESVISNDADNSTISVSSSDAAISLTSTKSRQVKASLRLKEADSDFLFTLNSSKRLSKAPKTIGAILNSGASSPLATSNNSVPAQSKKDTSNKKDTPCVRSKHDEELLERGEAIDISLPPKTQQIEKVNLREEKEAKPKVEAETVSSSGAETLNVPSRSYKRAKAVKSLADTTTNDVSETSYSQTENFDGSLSENVISSTSNDMLPSSTSEMNIKDEFLDLKGRDDFVSSSNIPDIDTSTVESSEQETATDDSTMDDSMVSVDTHRVKSQIDSELKKFGISEKDFIRVVLRNEGFDSFRAMIGPVVKWELCSNFVRKTFLTIWMWLQTSHAKKIKQFNCHKSSSPGLKDEKTRSPRNGKKGLHHSKNDFKKEPTETAADDSNVSEISKVTGAGVLPKKESFSSIVSKRLTRARIFGSPAKAAEERKSMHIDELYRELPLKKTTAVSKIETSKLACKSETSKIAERFAKSLKKKSLSKPVAKITKKKNRIGVKRLDGDLNVAGDTKEPKSEEKIANENNEDSALASISTEHLDKYLSTSPSVDELENTSFNSLGASDDPKSSGLPKIASRTKNVSRKDYLVLEPNSVRVPSKLRLTALEDVSSVVTYVELPLDENEEFEPGKKWVPPPQPIALSPPKECFETPIEEVSKKRKKRTLTPSIETSVDESQSTVNAASSPLQAKADRSPPSKRKSGGSTKPSGSKGSKGAGIEEVDLRLADDEMSAWVSRLTIGGLGQMIDSLQLSRLELKNAFSDTASSSLEEPCGLCDCCAMDLQCNECAACVNGEMMDPKTNIKCPFKLCLFHILLKYIRKQLEPTFNIVDYTNLWIRNRKVELLVHNILFLRKCITTLSPSKLNSSRNDQCNFNDQNPFSRNSESVAALPSSSEKKSSAASSSVKHKPKLVESSGTPNIFALLGQKLASSRKRPASSSTEPKSSACKTLKPLTVNVEDFGQSERSVLNVPSTNQLKNPLISANCASEPVESSDGSEICTSVRSHALDDDDGEMLIVETVEVEVRDQKSCGKENMLQVFIPSKLSNGVKGCGEKKGCNGGSGSGNGGKMTLRSSPDGVLEMGGSSGFGNGGGGDPSGLSAGAGGNVPPPDSPDSKYWCFAAAAASAEHNHSVRLSVDFPDYHYADRNYLHKHGLPVIGTQALPVASQCLICASAGQDPLLYCSVCCDPFHVYCIDRKYRPPSIERAYNWVCRSCFACRVCGQGSKLLECFICLRHYHLDCLPTEFYERDRKGMGMSSTWKCPQCSKCESCSGIPQTEITLNGVTHTLCLNCFSKIDMGDYCHLCLRVFSDDVTECAPCDEKTPAGENKPNGKTHKTGRAMRVDEQLDSTCEKIKCVNCNRWNHKTCESMTSEHCQLAKLMNSRAKAAHAAETKSCAEGEASSANQKPLISFKYRCQICSNNYSNIAPWSDKILYFLRMSIKAIIVSLLRSKCALHLVAIKSPSPHSLLSLNDINRNPQLGHSKVGYVGLRALTTKVKNPENSFKTIEEFRSDVEEIVKKSVLMQPELMMSTLEFCQMFQKEMKKMFPFYGGDQIAPRKFLPDTKKKSVSMDIIKHVNSDLINSIMDEHSYFPSPKSNQDVSEFKVLFNNLLDEDSKLVTETSKPKSSAESESTLSGSGFHDRRSCQLCMSKGDRPEKLEGRLLYCGQDEWVHVNCALWSSEVDESHTGAASLHHVFAAIHRGRSMRCAFCQEHGATVGCAAEHCSVQYHFTCARQTNCVFCTNGNTFCLQHKVHAIGLNVVKDFRVRRRVQVDLEEIRWKKGNNSTNNHSQLLTSVTSVSTLSLSTSNPFNSNTAIGPNQCGSFLGSSEENKSGLLMGTSPSNSVANQNNNSQLPARDVKVQVGSLSLRNLGSSHLSALSDTPSAIMPVSLKSSRLFWSTKDPLRQTLYRLTISETSPQIDLDKDNHTTSTSEEQMKNRQRRNSDPSCNSSQSFIGSANFMKVLSHNSLRRSYSCHELTALKDDVFSSSSESNSQKTEFNFSPSYFKDYLKFRSLNSFLQRYFQLFYSKMPRNRRPLSCPLCGKTISPTTWTQTHYQTCNGLSSLFLSQFKNSPTSRLKRSKWNISSQNAGKISKTVEASDSIMVQTLLQKIEGDPETTSMDRTLQEIQNCVNNHSRLPSSRTPKLNFHLESDDGFEMQSNSLQKVWSEVYRQVWECKAERGLLRDDITVGSFLSRQDNLDPLRLTGLSLDGVSFLLEQLPSAKFCSRYKFKFFNLKVQHLPVNPSGCARSEARKDTRTLIGRRDMFSWLSSKNRFRPNCDHRSMADLEMQLASSDRRKTNAELPLALRYRSLKKTAKSMCAVFRSDIHGRGLFSLQTIFPDEMIIEYTGELIRCTLTDKRERYYQSKGIGCYMFRMDEKHVIDATVSGNAARFVNHSCDPNCYSRVLVAENRKHIVIFASRLILKGEELTYDYKFDIEDESSKLQCHCGATNCRKYLN